MSSFRQKHRRRARERASQNRTAEAERAAKSTTERTQHKIAELRKPLAQKLADARTWAARTDPRDAKESHVPRPDHPRKLTEAGKRARLEAERSERGKRRKILESASAPDKFTQMVNENKAQSRKLHRARMKSVRALPLEKPEAWIEVEKPATWLDDEIRDAEEGWYAVEFEARESLEAGGT